MYESLDDDSPIWDIKEDEEVDFAHELMQLQRRGKLPPEIKSVEPDPSMIDLIEVVFNDGMKVYASPHFDGHARTPIDVLDPRGGESLDEDTLDFVLTGDAKTDVQDYLRKLVEWHNNYVGRQAKSSRRSALASRKSPIVKDAESRK